VLVGRTFGRTACWFPGIVLESACSARTASFVHVGMGVCAFFFACSRADLAGLCCGWGVKFD